MEPDPKYIKLLQKSFIMRKEKDIHMPMIAKLPTHSHYSFTSVFLSTGIHFLVYPMDTIKTRIQAKHALEKAEDFAKNTSIPKSYYTGILQGYACVIIGLAAHLTIGAQYGIYAATAVQGVAKTFVEISKAKKMMGNVNKQTRLLTHAYKLCLPLVILRDLTMRTTYNKLARQLEIWRRQYMIPSLNRTNTIVFSTIVASLLSNPFDLLFTKIATQKYLKYESVPHAIKTIYKEQKLSKLVFGGIGMRMPFWVLSSMMMLNLYDPLMQMVVQAF